MNNVNLLIFVFRYLLVIMPSWLQVDAGLLYYHISELEILIKIIKKSGNCYICSVLRADLQSLCTKFNPQLQFSEEVILKLLEDALESSSNLSIDEETIDVTSNIELTNITLPFLWQFTLSPCPDMIEDVLHPIFSSVMLLIEQKHALVSLIKKKDKEISEFRSLGLTLSKKSKLSAPFNSAHSLKNVHIPNMSTPDILANDSFREAFQQSIIQNKKISVANQKKNKHVHQTGVTFDESFSQPDCPLFTDSDVKLDVKKKEIMEDITVASSIKSEDIKYDLDGEKAEVSSSTLPVMKRKKPRRL